jgi:acetyltransferase-like isoleucine patch superfamily enzyme
MTDVSPEYAHAATTRSTSRSALALIAHALREPWVAIREGRAILKGLRCRAWCRLRGVRLKAGRNLRIDGRLILRGPGAVVLGDNVRIGMTVTPWTYAADAVITIGDDSFVNGTSFACAREIRIGRRAILGRSSIMDTDFHSVRVERHDPGAPIRVEPVILGDNVWIAAQAGILPGTRIGANSVVGFGAVCAGVFPDNVVIAGNPAKVIKRLAE